MVHTYVVYGWYVDVDFGYYESRVRGDYGIGCWVDYDVLRVYVAWAHVGLYGTHDYLVVLQKPTTSITTTALMIGRK